jgi:glyoxylase-like metal-dependent hydrolase (beta-lactamase superfamily II)
MRSFILALTILLLALPAYPFSEYPPYRVEIAPGVFVVLNTDPLGLANHSNSAYIVTGDDVILVDTQFTRDRTMDVLRFVRHGSARKISVLINTHWHDDHTFGNQLVRVGNPNVEIIATSQTKRDMAGIGVTNRKQQVAGAPEGLKFFQACVDSNKTVDGKPLSPQELAAYRSTIGIMGQYLAEQPQFELTLPTKTFDDKLVLRRGQRAIEVRHLGPAVTDGDAVVWLPVERILIAGDIVDNPLPFAYRSNVNGWIAALDEIKKLNPRIIVPGHGEIMRDMQGVDRLRAMLVSIRDQTNASVANGDSLQAVQAKIKIDDLRADTVGTNRMLAFLFDDFFLKPAVASAFKEATGK